MSVRLICGHVLAEMAKLPAESVHCVVTSPPYLGLRDYKIDPQIWGGDAGCLHDFDFEIPGQKRSGGTQSSTLGEASGGHAISDEARLRSIERSMHSAPSSALCRRCGSWRGSLGLEPTLSLYLDHMVEVMRAVRRVMRKDATCWLNIGDGYCASPAGNKIQTAFSAEKGGRYRVDNYQQRVRRNFGSLKPKDLMMVPHRLAIRLQEDGWYVRSDIIWAKTAPMPESTTDRPTSAHEHVFLLTKSAKYFYDSESVKEDAQSERGSGNGYKREASLTHRDANGPRGQDAGWQDIGGKHNLRNVWTLGPEPFPEAHFAVFVSEIPRRAILAGTSARGVCAKCGAPWIRKVEPHLMPGPKAAKTFVVDERDRDADDNDQGSNRQKDGHRPGWRRADETVGWEPTCRCDAGASIPATVLDPFAGSGTSLLVADRLQRNAIGIELNPEYVEMARRRIFRDAPLFVRAAE